MTISKLEKPYLENPFGFLKEHISSPLLKDHTYPKHQRRGACIEYKPKLEVQSDHIMVQLSQAILNTAG